LNVAGDKVYFSDESATDIIQTSLTGAGTGNLINSGVNGPADIALDLVGGKLYWTVDTTDQLQRANLDGTGIEVLASGIVTPRDIDVLGVSGTTSTPPGLWLSTSGNVTSSGAPGLNAWQNGEAIELGDPNLAFEPGTTDGTFSSAANLETLAGTDLDVDALHYVTRAITVGTTNTVDLQVGDLLFSTNGPETIQSLAVDRDDIVLFRPDTPGDYSSGTFSYVFRGPIGGTEMKSFSLIERDTTFGDTTLQAGDFLFTQEAGSGNDIYAFHTADAGDGTTSGTAELLIEGSDVGITAAIDGLELVETNTTLGDETLAAGEMLVSIDGLQGGIGTSNVTADEQDIFRLQVVKTTAVTGTSVADAALLLDAGLVGLDTSGEDLDALTMVSSATATVAPSSELTVTTAADIDDGDTSSVSALIADPPGADGEISLREAITAANNTDGLNRIEFDIAGSGPHTILLDPVNGALPNITGTVIIDGTSEPDYSDAPVVEIDGSDLSAEIGDNYDAFRLTTGSDGSTIRGLSITNFTDDGVWGDAFDDHGCQRAAQARAPGSRPGAAATR
jgi:hypothetical protein